jgi:hypothetical protein
VAQALIAAALTDDYARVQALNGLAHHLPPDLMSEALAATPKSSAAVLTAVLKRVRSVLAPAGDAAFVDLMRDGLDGIDRDACLGLITAIAPAIAEIGGIGAIQQGVNAVADVYRWWP